MKNNSLKETVIALEEADSILLFPHVNMDGDSLGSSVALCKGLRSMRKNCFILIDEEVPIHLKFLDRDYCSKNKDVIKNPDLCVAVDCGEVSRFKLREEAFFSGKKTMTIDHHLSTDPVFDFNYIETGVSATSMLVYYILKGLSVKIDKEMGEALWAGITTDTGNFQYSNTNKETHLLVADLYDVGIDHNKVSINIYENIRPEKVLMTNRAMDNIRFFAQGKGALAYISLAMLAETGASPYETEGIVESLRKIAGVEVAAFLREDDDNEIKVSMRSKSYANVAEVAMRFNGGGHKNAAGCTINSTMDFAIKMIIRELETALLKEE